MKEESAVVNTVKPEVFGTSTNTLKLHSSRAGSLPSQRDPTSQKIKSVSRRLLLGCLQQWDRLPGTGFSDGMV